MKYIKNFSEVSLADTALVGGKNASLGHMIVHLTKAGIRVPHGFAITADAYWYYLEHNTLTKRIQDLLEQILDRSNVAVLRRVGAAIRVEIAQGQFPDDLAHEIKTAYQALSKEYGREACDVAVRSSATAEDLPGASFAGQQETFLNVRGEAQLLQKCKECMASLFTDRAIIYRHEKGFDHFKVALSVGVQKMVRSDRAYAGVAFSIDPETGFKDAVVINAAYGLGEMLVQGEVIPDEYIVHKPTLAKGYASIIKKEVGTKARKLIYAATASERTSSEDVPLDLQQQYCLTDQEVLELAHMAVAIENAYTAWQKAWSPMDIEWAKDGFDGLLYCVQARPETVHSVKKHPTLVTYTIADHSFEQLRTQAIITGQSIGTRIVAGSARIITSIDEADEVKQGDILVTHMTDPDWMPIMKRVAGIITDSGGRTCHAAIVARELGIPALVGAHEATTILKNGQGITLDCSRGVTGYVYDGSLSITSHMTEVTAIKKPATTILVNIADPANAFTAGMLPVDGVGLARMEFIMGNLVRIHPMACVHSSKISDESVRRQIAHIAGAFSSAKEFCIQTLARGIGMIAAGFYPRQVVVRFSDFKSSEYRNLIGGSYFEPEEENPMLGLRGASRYYSDAYKDAFALECAAVKHARDIFGLKNIALMIPFVRTIDEAREVVSILKKHGLERGNDDLSLLMMVELPSNIFLLKEFSTLFDGFSIGSNDLTQIMLGVDRDSAQLSGLFDERNPAVLEIMKMAIKEAHANNKKIGICGQAPSDYPEVADTLIKAGIDSLSLNVDAVIPFLIKKNTA